jgi:hypothetical protein
MCRPSTALVQQLDPIVLNRRAGQDEGGKWMVRTYFRFEVTQQRRRQRTHTLTIPAGGAKKRERVENVEHRSLPVQNGSI